jgi:ribonuclease J
MPKITILDGARSIGGSKIHLQTQGMGILLDFGMNYKRWGEFYAEFLGPRSTRGINDLLLLGILPPLKGVYRDDVFPGDFNKDSFLQIELQVDAVFLTHAHKDHCQHIGLLQEDIPIYCSPLTAMIMKAMQDTGKNKLEDEMVYITKAKFYEEKKSSDGGEEKVEDKRRLKRGGEKIGKDIYIFGSKNPKMEQFFQTSPIQTPFSKPPSLTFISKLPSLVVARDKFNEKIEFRYFPVDHSIPGATAFAIQTDSGWIVYSGDLRLHGRNGPQTLSFLEAASSLKPLALIIEGTRLEEEKPKRISEDEVFENCLKEVKNAEGKLVVADFAPRNIERLLSFLHIARETNRKLCILTNDIYLLEVFDSVEGTNYLQEENLAIFEKVKDTRDNWEKKLKERHGGKFVKYSEIRENPGDYILCFSFFDINHMTDIICEEGGIYIYSSSEAYEEEQIFDFVRLKNWLDFLNLKPVGFTIEENSKNPIFPEGYHSSGHATKEDLFEIVRRIRPKYLIPVHTELEKPYEELRDITQIIWDDAKYTDLEVKIYGK